MDSGTVYLPTYLPVEPFNSIEWIQDLARLKQRLEELKAFNSIEWIRVQEESPGRARVSRCTFNSIEWILVYMRLDQVVRRLKPELSIPLNGFTTSLNSFGG